MLNRFAEETPVFPNCSYWSSSALTPNIDTTRSPGAYCLIKNGLKHTESSSQLTTDNKFEILIKNVLILKLNTVSPVWTLLSQEDVEL